jgi:hypothetical protein
LKGLTVIIESLFSAMIFTAVFILLLCLVELFLFQINLLAYAPHIWFFVMVVFAFRTDRTIALAVLLVVWASLIAGRHLVKRAMWHEHPEGVKARERL